MSEPDERQQWADRVARAGPFTPPSGPPKWMLPEWQRAMERIEAAAVPRWDVFDAVQYDWRIVRISYFRKLRVQARRVAARLQAEARR